MVSKEGCFLIARGTEEVLNETQGDIVKDNENNDVSTVNLEDDTDFEEENAAKEHILSAEQTAGESFEDDGEDGECSMCAGTKYRCKVCGKACCTPCSGYDGEPGAKGHGDFRNHRSCQD